MRFSPGTRTFGGLDALFAERQILGGLQELVFVSKMNFAIYLLSSPERMTNLTKDSCTSSPGRT